MNAQPIPGELDGWRKFLLRPIVVVVMGQMGQQGPSRADAACRGEGFIETHMGRVGLAPQRVEHRHLYPTGGGYGLGRHFLAVAEVSKLFQTPLAENESKTGKPPVRQSERGYFEVAQDERSGDNYRVRRKIPLRPGLIGESIREYPREVVLGLTVCINGL